MLQCFISHMANIICTIGCYYTVCFTINHYNSRNFMLSINIQFLQLYFGTCGKMSLEIISLFRFKGHRTSKGTARHFLLWIYPLKVSSVLSEDTYTIESSFLIPSLVNNMSPLPNAKSKAMEIGVDIGHHDAAKYSATRSLFASAYFSSENFDSGSLDKDCRAIVSCSIWWL